MAARKVLHFRFQTDAHDRERQDVIRTLGEQGADAVAPLFPNSQSDPLSSLYTVEFQADETGERLLGTLESSGAVDFAEYAVRRKSASPTGKGKLSERS
jgi:hypothetical protein